MAVGPVRTEEAIRHLRGRFHLRIVPVRTGTKYRANGGVPAAAGDGWRRACSVVPIRIAGCLFAEERGQAMAIWGIGVMLGPIMGPTLGAWLTDNYSWHWVFLINLPIGVITMLGMLAFMEETQKHEHLRFDWFGFVALAIGIGSLQLLLDRGEQV